ncbi:MAG: hypothetical protein U0768_12140 [Anaerolineae bacterium]
MTTLTIELPTDVYERLRVVAEDQGKPIETLVSEWLTERTDAPALKEPTERERLRSALRAAGMLAEPSQEMRQLADESTLSLEEARAILDRVGGKPLSEVILEMRGPKS